MIINLQNFNFAPVQNLNPTQNIQDCLRCQKQKIDELETIEKIEKIPEPKISIEEKSIIEKPNNQTERVQTRHQTKIQRELNTIEEESEPDSD